MADKSVVEKEKGGKVQIFDTTLRDGEQSPGCSMNTEQKLQIAHLLAEMNVDVIEAGFPIASPGDFEAVKRIAQEVKGPQVAGLCRANDKDIDRAWEALQHAEEKARIHTFIATSELHLVHKLRMTESEVVNAARAAVKRAASYSAGNVEFSAEDAVRTRLPFLAQVITEVIDAGATVVNIPDTVGYTTPWEYGQIIAFLREFVPNINQAIISVHCHNDLGLAVANSLSAVMAGARQVECTINGIGERAGNCSLEEIVMALRTRGDIIPFYSDVVTEKIVPASRLLVATTGMQVQRNKAIVGGNAFAHEAGIHQHGFLMDKRTYEIMTPESVGLKESKLPLGKHSSKRVLANRLKAMGFTFSKEEIEELFMRFKELADKKMEVFDDDLLTLVQGDSAEDDMFVVNLIEGSFNSESEAKAYVSLECDGKDKEFECKGNGPVDAVFKAIKEITKTDYRLDVFSMDNVTKGISAQATCSVVLEAYDRTFSGHGVHTDSIAAAGMAYTNALNKIVKWELHQLEVFEKEESDKVIAS
ncbi:2-isopropylmalate synthase [Candidatus Parcubacteria bacterium]|nr:MAG: 2-isopropylmalate synthase [Candidatus Parcubacteria bacterium]